MTCKEPKKPDDSVVVLSGWEEFGGCFAETRFTGEVRETSLYERWRNGGLAVPKRMTGRK